MDCDSTPRAPYKLLFSVKAPGSNGQNYFIFHNSKVYTRTPSKVWELQILMRSHNQHCNAFESYNCSFSSGLKEVPNECEYTLSEDRSIMDNITKSIRLYFCMLNASSGERFEKRYIRHSSVLTIYFLISDK